MEQVRKKWFVWLGLFVFLAVTGTICGLAWQHIRNFVADPEALRLWVEGHIWWGRILFCLLLVIQVFAAIIPGEPLEMAAGYVFGTVEGTVLCLIGEGIGGILVFFVVRRFGMQLVESIFPRKKIRHLAFLQDPKKRDLLLFCLFFLPGTPKDLLCYAGGLTGVSLPVWILIQTLGRLPAILTSTLGGNALGTKQHRRGFVVLGMTAVISVLGILLYRKIAKGKKE